MAMTLNSLLALEKDNELIDIQLELRSGIVPKDGKAHTYRRKINKMMDAGELCINQSTYRKVYLASLAKAVQNELARRYTEMILNNEANKEDK